MKRKGEGFPEMTHSVVSSGNHEKPQLAGTKDWPEEAGHGLGR